MNCHTLLHHPGHWLAVITSLGRSTIVCVGEVAFSSFSESENFLVRISRAICYFLGFPLSSFHVGYHIHYLEVSNLYLDVSNLYLEVSNLVAVHCGHLHQMDESSSNQQLLLPCKYHTVVARVRGTLLDNLAVDAIA